MSDRYGRDGQQEFIKLILFDHAQCSGHTGLPGDGVGTGREAVCLACTSHWIRWLLLKRREVVWPWGSTRLCDSEVLTAIPRADTLSVTARVAFANALLAQVASRDAPSAWLPPTPASDAGDFNAAMGRALAGYSVDATPWPRATPETSIIERGAPLHAKSAILTVACAALAHLLLKTRLGGATSPVLPMLVVSVWLYYLEASRSSTRRYLSDSRTVSLKRAPPILKRSRFSLRQEEEDFGVRASKRSTRARDDPRQGAGERVCVLALRPRAWTRCFSRPCLVRHASSGTPSPSTTSSAPPAPAFFAACASLARGSFFPMLDLHLSLYTYDLGLPGKNRQTTRQRVVTARAREEWAFGLVSAESRQDADGSRHTPLSRG